MAFLGVDIGSSTTRAALIDEDFHMLALANGPTHIDDNFQTTVDDVYAASRKALDQVGFRFGAIDAICISVSGVADDKTGRVFSPVLHWIDPMPVRTIVHRYVSVPVFVSNDATAAAIGEAHYGSGMSYGRFALLRMGTLIEIAMASDGAPFESDLLPAQVATEGEFLLEAHELRAHEEGEDGIDLSGIDSGFATVEDLGSLNGTWVDGAIVNKAMLKDGSTIQIGTFRMVFHTNRRPQRIETGN